MLIRILNGVLDKADTLLALVLRLIGPLFAFGVTIFDFIVFISFITTTLPFIKQCTGELIAKPIALIEICLFLNLQLNFFLALLVKPGSLQDLSRSTKPPAPCSFDLSDILSNEANQLPIDSAKELPLCNKCNSVKLLRAHHCSICNQCIIKMDHHCPWINNCIGLNNHRYFLLFLFYAHSFLIYSLLLGVLVFIWRDPSSKKEMYRVSMIINIVSLFMTSFFIMWQWTLVLKGVTTIEYWMMKTGRDKEEIIKDYSLCDWRDNLMVVFGTRSLLKALFIPSFKRLLLCGSEWTRLVFKDYEINKLK